MSIQIHKYVYIEDPIDLNSSSYSVNIQKSIQISDTLNFKYILIQQSIFYKAIPQFYSFVVKIFSLLLNFMKIK